jgi:lipoate-protein ligase A
MPSWRSSPTDAVLSGDTVTGIAVWRDGAADGPTNMAADECLAAESVRRGGLVIRLYRWETTTVSLGAFQPIAAARACEAIAGLPLVRRPSGGGAIVHGSDFTYAAAIPKRHRWGSTPQALYDAVHGAMIESLRSCGVETRLAEPDPAAETEFFCFDRRSGGDLIAGHPDPDDKPRSVKLMGSAQRRLADAVLQHGSLLLVSNPDVGPAARHASLADLSGAGGILPAGWSACVDEWLGRIAAALGQQIEEQAGAFLRRGLPGLPVGRERFAASRWTNRR